MYLLKRYLLSRELKVGGKVFQHFQALVLCWIKTRVEPLLTDTSPTQTAHLVLGKCLYILCKNNLVYNMDPL